MKEIIFSIVIILSPLLSVELYAAEAPCDSMPDMSELRSSMLTISNAMDHSGHDMSQAASDLNMDCPCDHKGSVSHSLATLETLGRVTLDLKSTTPVFLYSQLILPAISSPLLRPPIAA
jgi:hypothetical protein